MTPGLIRKAWVHRGPLVSGRMMKDSLSSSSLAGHPAKCGHDAAEALTQLQSGVAGQLGRVVEAFDLR